MGIGGSKSKAVINQLSEVITNVSMSTVQSCEVAAEQEQTLEVTNSGLKLWGSYSLTQQTEIQTTCFSDVNKQVQLQNQLINAIKQTSTADGVAILSAFGASQSEAEVNLTNLIKNNITMSNIQKSYTAIKQKQSAKFDNTGIIGFESADLTQGSKIFAAATLQEMDKAGIFNTISNHVEQVSTATTSNPLDVFGNMSSLIIFAIIFLVMIIAAVLIFGAVTLLKTGRYEQD